MIRKLVVMMSIVLGFALAGGLACGAYYWEWLNKPLPALMNLSAQQEQQQEQPRGLYHVKRGKSLSHIALDLHAKGVIEWPKVWVLYARANKQTAVKAGEYQLDATDTPLSILTKLVRGDVVSYSVTLVEGTTFKELMAKLHREPKLIKTLESLSSAEIVDTLNLDIQHPEGWFFPDTYQYTAGDTDKAILLRAHRAMRSTLETLWQSKAEGLPYASPYEALIMASIVEKETGVAREREEIAGVFVRRLQKRMRLQTDPTVIYGMGDAYNGNITRKDLKTPTPYNTYVIKGMPPTPIAMPGKEAIYAALNPAYGEALYFVAKGDGTHYFSATLDEHLDAVARYQKRRKANYRSAPPATTNE